jgi:hypothetical protein
MGRKIVLFLSMVLNAEKMKRINLLLVLVFIIITSMIKCRKSDDYYPDTSNRSTNVGDLQVFPSDNPWNTAISGEETDPNSDVLIASIGKDVHLHPDFGTTWEGSAIGIPFNVVGKDQPKVNVSFYYSGESDQGPYPIPRDALIEEGSDRHVLVVDTFNQKLYELYNASKNGDGSWHAGSGAIFDLNSNKLRSDNWTSADVAGLPIFPGLVRYEEVVLKGEINHALRFTVNSTRNAFVHPATHAASDIYSESYPPMGMRVRLKAGFDISGFSPNVQVILKCLKKYGMFVADNGSNWYISGEHNMNWDDEELGELKTIEGSNFEVVKMDTVFTMSSDK